jgi:Domain of unknown function (DUF4431)
MTARAFAFLFALLASPGAHAAEVCLGQSGDTGDATGVLATERHKHPNGTNFTAYVLRLAKPACAVVEDMADSKKRQTVRNIRRMQIVPNEKESELKSHLGKTIALHGRLMQQHTAWHITPVLIFADKITVPGR